MKKYDTWISLLFALVFIAIPSIIGIFFLIDEVNFNYGIIWGIGIGIVIIGNLLTFIFYKLGFFSFDAFNFIFPLTMVFLGLYVTMYQEWWLMLIVTILMILTSFPTNILINKFKDNKKNKKN